MERSHARSARAAEAGFETALDYYYFLRYDDKAGPELQALIGCQQEHEWHPEGCVWVHSLMVTDELCVTDLAATAGMRESTTSHALRLLRTNRVVRARRAGRTVYYSLADEHVRHVLHDVLAHAQHADDD